MKLWKHVNNKDVAFQVLKSFYVKEKRIYKMKVEWWNIGPHEAWPMGITQRIQIPVDIWIKDWQEISSSYRAPSFSEVLDAKSDGVEVYEV